MNLCRSTNSARFGCLCKSVCVSVLMQGEQKHTEWIFLGWEGHGLVAGESI